jgi:hypothetical protein
LKRRNKKDVGNCCEKKNVRELKKMYKFIYAARNLEKRG